MHRGGETAGQTVGQSTGEEAQKGRGGGPFDVSKTTVASGSSSGYGCCRCCCQQMKDATPPALSTGTEILQVTQK